MKKVCRQLPRFRRSKARRKVQGINPRILGAEPLENRLLLASDWQNLAMPLDANFDSAVTPADALAVVNDLNEDGSRLLEERGESEAGPLLYAVDINGDGVASSADVLTVVNHLNGEGENGDVVRYILKTFDLTKMNVVMDGASFEDSISFFEIADSNSTTIAFEFEDASVDPGLFDPDAFAVNYESGDDGTPSTTDEIATAIVAAITAANTAGDTTLSATNSGSQILLTNDSAVTIPRTVRGLTFTSDEISTVGLGQDFYVKVFAEDIRMTTREGVFSGYIDVTFDPTLASIVENAFVQRSLPTEAGVNGQTSIMHNHPLYGNGPEGDATTTAGRIDGGGSFANVLSGPGSGEFFMWQFRVTANEQGTITFTPEPTTDSDPDSPNFDPNDVGQSPALDTGLFGENTAVCPSVATTGCMGEMDFVPVSIDVASEISAVNDPRTIDEDSGATNIDVLANDIVNSPPGGSPILESSTLPSLGSLVRESNDTFTYTPFDDANGSDSFTYVINNGEGASNTGTVAITITPINDLPINSVPGDQTVDEDDPLSISGLSISDVDGDIDATVSLSVSNGTLTVSDTTGTASGSGSSSVSFSGALSDINTELSGLSYTPSVNVNGSDTLSISTTDNGNVGGGALSDADTVNITINPINDAPVNTVVGSQTVFNDAMLEFGSGDLQVSDVDASTLEVNLSVSLGTVSLTSTSGLEVSGNESTSLTATGSVLALNIGLGSLVYEPDPIDGLAQDTLTMTTSDLGGTGAGNVLTDTDTVDIKITPPQTPFAANNTFLTEEGAAVDLTFTVTDLLDNDIAPEPMDENTLSLTLINDATPTSTFSTANGSVAFNSSSGTFTYTPDDTDFFGTETFTYTIESAPDAGNGPSTGTVNIEVQPINDGPVNTIPGSQDIDEDNDLVFSGSSALSLEDIDAGDAGVTVTLTVGSGTLNISSSGASVTGAGSGDVELSGTVSEVNSSLGGLTYSPTLNFAGTDTLTMTTNDNGNTGGSAGNLTASNPLSDVDTVNITIDPINDAPTIVVPAIDKPLFVNQDNLLSDLDNTAFNVSDVDAGNEDISVSLTIGDGTLTVTSTSGLSVDGDGTSSLSLFGSQTDINAALNAGINYNPNNANEDTLSLTVDDLGNTGGGNDTTASASITVTPLEFTPSKVGGLVFVDDSQDGSLDAGDRALLEIEISLNGTDSFGQPISMTAITGSDGRYLFDGLAPGLYTITQNQPLFTIDGADLYEHPVVSAGNDSATVEIGMLGGVEYLNNNFTEEGLEPRFFDGHDLLSSSQPGGVNYDHAFFATDGSSFWASFTGSSWAGYSSPTVELSSDMSSVLFSAVDASGSTRSATISTDDATRLRVRSDGDDMTIRFLGTASEIFDSNGVHEEAESEGDLAANDKQSSDEYTDDVDQIMAALA